MYCMYTHDTCTVCILMYCDMYTATFRTREAMCRDAGMATEGEIGRIATGERQGRDREDSNRGETGER